MIIGVLKETKVEENRVAVTPAGVEIMRQHGHEVLVQRTAGNGSGFEDGDYVRARAEIVETPEEIYERSAMVMRVKELEPGEWEMLRPANVVDGHVAYQGVAEAFGLPFTPVDAFL